MKRVGIALAGAVALAACGSRSGTGNAPVMAGAREPCPDGVTLRVVGVNPGAVSSLVLHPGSVQAALLDGGANVPVTGTGDPVLDVSTDARMYDLGVLHFALSSGRVAGTVTFSDGTAAMGTLSGTLDVCTGPLAFVVDPGRVPHDACEVVLGLDVGRSVAASDGRLVFVPNYRLVY